MVVFGGVVQVSPGVVSQVVDQALLAGGRGYQPPTDPTGGPVLQPEPTPPPPPDLGGVYGQLSFNAGANATFLGVL